MSDTHVAEAPDTPVTPPVDTEIETRARRLGWVPKDEFKGDPAKHRSADEFLERGTTILPILQRDNERLHGQVSALSVQLKETQEATKELLAFTSKSEERAYNRAKADIQAKIEAAAATADPIAVRAGMAELDALAADHKPAAPKTETAKPAVAADPIIQDWIAKEEWYSRDRTLNAYATDEFGKLERDHPGMSKAEMLIETKKRTMDKFPEKFGINPARNGAAPVAEPRGESQRRKTGKTYEDLPADAKKACDKFVKQIPGYTREKYVKDYDWND